MNNRLEGCAPKTIAAMLNGLAIPRPIVEVRPVPQGWMVYESDDLRPSYASKEDAISYARFLGTRMKRRAYVVDANGNIADDLGLAFPNEPRVL